MVKQAPLSGRVLDTHLAAVEFDQMLDDGQPQPGPPGIAGARLVDAVEALEDSRQLFLRNPGPSSVTEIRTAARLSIDRDANAAGLRRVARRVGDQVPEHVVQLGRIGRQPCRRRRLWRSPPPAAAPRADGFSSSITDCSSSRASHRCQLERLLAGIEASQAKQVLHEALHAPRVRHQDVVEPAPIVRVDVRFGKRLEVSAHGGQRRPQLVRDVRHEVAADLVRAAQIRDVVQHDHDADAPPPASDGAARAVRIRARVARRRRARPARRAAARATRPRAS